MFRLKQCLSCDSLSLHRDKEVVVCKNCGDRFNEKAINSVLREFSCSNLNIARSKAKKNNKLKLKLDEIGVF